MAVIWATAATFWSFKHELKNLLPGDRRLVCVWRRDPQSGRLFRSWKPVTTKSLY